jgi:hypothetical protein
MFTLFFPEKSRIVGSGWQLGKVVRVLSNGGGFDLRQAAGGLDVFLFPGLLPKCMLDLMVSFCKFSSYFFFNPS